MQGRPDEDTHRVRASLSSPGSSTLVARVISSAIAGVLVFVLNAMFRHAGLRHHGRFRRPRHRLPGLLALGFGPFLDCLLIHMQIKRILPLKGPLSEEPIPAHSEGYPPEHKSEHREDEQSDDCV